MVRFDSHQPHHLYLGPHIYKAASAAAIGVPRLHCLSPPAFPAPYLHAPLTALIFPVEAPHGLPALPVPSSHCLSSIMVNFNAIMNSKSKPPPVLSSRFTPGRLVPPLGTPGGRAGAWPWQGVAEDLVLFLGLAPAPSDLCQVISLLCALASSSAEQSQPVGSPGGMLSHSPAARGAADGEADVSQPVLCFWVRGLEGYFLLGGSLILLSHFFYAFPFQGWRGTEEPH